ncbi:MAG: zinc ribbon domain-containing protein [Gammaproteobacteria bacterium]|nr:MAG: zinc ribbon domain-containing protein [Gammaproteobacteria bacterium]
MKCTNCHKKLENEAVWCTRCGMPVDRSRQVMIGGVRISFPVWVVLITLFCAFMILWLPRTIH